MTPWAAQGTRAFLAAGAGMLSRYAADPRLGAVFNTGTTVLTATTTAAVVAAYGFSGFELGGGRGRRSGAAGRCDGARELGPADRHALSRRGLLTAAPFRRLSLVARPAVSRGALVRPDRLGQPRDQRRVLRSDVERMADVGEVAKELDLAIAQHEVDGDDEVAIGFEARVKRLAFQDGQQVINEILFRPAAASPLLRPSRVAAQRGCASGPGADRSCRTRSET